MNYRGLIRQLCCLMTAAFLLFPPVIAEAEREADGKTSGYEDALSGFDESDAAADDVAASAETDAEADSGWDLSGAVTLSSVWNVAHEAPKEDATDHRGLSRLRTELDLALDVNLWDSWRSHVGGRGFYDFAYEIQGRDEFTGDVLDEYEDELEFREAYIEGALLPGLDLKAGRQIIIWGNSENFRVTDVLNPLDNRDPGLVDIEDLRLPVCMARLDYQWDDPYGNYNLTGVVIPEMRFSKNPVFGNDFYPFDAPLPSENTPNNIDDSEYAMAVKGVFRNWDLSLYGASYYDDNTYLGKNGKQEAYPVMLPGGGIYWQWVDKYERRHARLWMTGLAANFALGDWLIKTELARSDGYKYVATADEKKQTSGLAGIEYMGFTDTTLTLEFIQTCIHDFKDSMRSAPDYADSSRFETAFRFTQDRMNNRVELVFLAIVMGAEAEDGVLERLSAAYDITDALTVTGGGVFYQDGRDLTTDNIHDNNRLFVDLKYSF